MSPQLPYIVKVEQMDSDMSSWIANNVKSPLFNFFGIEIQDKIVVLRFGDEQDAIIFKLTFEYLY